LEGAPRLLRRIDWGYRDEVIAPQEFALADRVVVQSDFSVRSFREEGFPADRLVVLPRAVELGAYSPGQRRAKGPFRVLFVGMVCIRKGFLDLARAWKELALPDGELWVVGQVHEELTPLLGRYRDDPSIRFFGHRKEGVSRFYSEATVFVLPSIVEGSAKTTYEAMAAGLPVVTTENAGSVVRNGIDGFLVPIRDTDALKERLLFFYKNRNEAWRMGKAASEQVVEYAWEHYDSRLVSLYRELMGRDGVG